MELNRDYPAGSWEVLAASVTVDTLAWTTSGAASFNARARVSLVADAGVADVSDENFRIATPSLLLTSPLGGDSGGIGLPLHFTWSGSGFGTSVNIEVKRAYPSGTWEIWARV